MARADLPDSLHEIRNPTTAQNRIAALKRLKHEIIGHELRKELVVHHGVVRGVVAGLLVGRNTRGKSRRAEDSDEGEEGGVEGGWDEASDERQREREAWSSRWEEEDEVRLQSTQIVGCLAHGGLPFVHPLLAGDVVPPLLSALSPGTVPPRLIVETLRAINAIAEALATDLLSPPESAPMRQLASQLFSKPVIDDLAEILAQRNASVIVDEQITLTMKILSHAMAASGQGQEQANLVKAGVLDLLASRLASLVVKMGHTFHTRDSALVSTMLPAPPRRSLQHLLHTLTFIVRFSTYRSMRLLYSRDLLAIFPIASPSHQTGGDYLSFADQTTPPISAANPLDYLLPKLQAVQNKNEHNFSRAFPALGSFVNPSELSRMPYFSDGQMVSTRTISADEFGSPLIAWLILMARTSTVSEGRVEILELLVHLISALDQNIMDTWTESSRNRDRTLAFLVVPLLVRIVEATEKPQWFQNCNPSSLPRLRELKERAPHALAVLIEDCPALQKAAVDANVIKLLCQMLKKSFDPITTSKKPVWSPHPQEPALDLEDDRTCNLGPQALAPEAVHTLMCRAAALKALAAIAQKEDNHRKSIIENGVVPCVADSLAPYPDGPLSAMHPTPTGTSPEGQKDGNPNFVIVEACKLATALSRSVSILRTSLIDGGIARPIFTLLRSSDRVVREAATDTVTNLVLHFSPMREDLMSQGILKILCDHAHSAEANMRISALWALKHLANAAPNDIKMAIIEELGTGWLIHTMSGESHSMASHRSHLATPNAAGEQVDLLNIIDEPGMDVDDEEAEDSSEDSDIMADSIGHLRIPSVPSQHRARLKAIRQEEENLSIRARKDDIRIQEQALDLVRNLISEAGPSQPEMIDHLLQAMGPQRLFECLGNKLKPKSAGSSHHSSTSGGGPSIPAGKRPTLTTPSASNHSNSNKLIQDFPAHLYLHPRLLESTLFILIHIANGKPTHRHTLLNLITTPSFSIPVNGSSTATANATTATQQQKLLDLTLPLFSHPNRRIRVACCWLVHNIMWMEDQSDEVAARSRAMELRARGYEDAVLRCVGDQDLDVKERARGCVDVWGRLLGGEDAARGVGGAGRTSGLRAGERGWQ